jgi:hypothetical protein
MGSALTFKSKRILFNRVLNWAKRHLVAEYKCAPCILNEAYIRKGLNFKYSYQKYISKTEK